MFQSISNFRVNMYFVIFRHSYSLCDNKISISTSNTMKLKQMSQGSKKVVVKAKRRSTKVTMEKNITRMLKNADVLLVRISSCTDRINEF